MAKARYQPSPPPKAVVDENAKMAKLRQLRLADDAARREAGTFGDLSVIEIADETSGEIFVLYWKGGMVPDLAKLLRTRAPGLSLEEHERLQAWLAQHELPYLKQSQLGWNLSLAEAKRAKQARIDERKAGGHYVVNEEPIRQPAN